MSKSGFDQVWDYLPHFSFYQLGLACGISTVALVQGLWVLWPVFGFYRPVRYRCTNILDQIGRVTRGVRYRQKFSGLLLNFFTGAKAAAMLCPTLNVYPS